MDKGRPPATVCGKTSPHGSSDEIHLRGSQSAAIRVGLWVPGLPARSRNISGISRRGEQVRVQTMEEAGAGEWYGMREGSGPSFRA